MRRHHLSLRGNELSSTSAGMRMAHRAMWPPMLGNSKQIAMIRV